MLKTRKGSEQESFPSAWLTLQARHQETLSIKDQLVSISKFADHVVSAQLLNSAVMAQSAARDNM